VRRGAQRSAATLKIEDRSRPPEAPAASGLAPNVALPTPARTYPDLRSRIFRAR
jgi:hypothetical protein